MKAEDILLALGEIDETLPPECTQPVRKKPIPWKGIASAAACIAAVILSTVFLHHVGMLGRHVGMFGIIHSEPESETETTEWIVWETVTESNTEETQAAEPVMQGGSNNYYPTTRRSSTPKTTVAPVTKPSTTVKGCEHEWIDATCTTPRKCRKCGITAGNPNKHSFAPATCEKPETCRNCGVTQGIAKGHNYDPATGFCKNCHKNIAGTKDPNWPPTTEPKAEKPTEQRTEANPTTTTTVSSRPVSEKYPDFFYNGKWYYYSGASNRQQAVSRLTTITLQSSDGMPENDASAEVYSISGSAPETAVLVLLSDGSCYRYESGSGKTGNKAQSGSSSYTEYTDAEQVIFF